MNLEATIGAPRPQPRRTLPPLQAVCTWCSPDNPELAILSARWHSHPGGNQTFCLVIVGAAQQVGSGRAGNDSYSREAAAFQDALEAAGVELTLPVDGRGMGDDGIDLAAVAVAAALGYAGPLLCISHAA